LPQVVVVEVVVGTPAVEQLVVVVVKMEVEFLAHVPQLE
jgi:hypothetical protein